VLVIDNGDRLLALTPLHPIVRSVVGDLDDLVSETVGLSLARASVALPKPVGGDFDIAAICLP
jgi:hypothetical protein